MITLGRDSCFQHGQMLISDIQVYKAASRIEVWSTLSSVYDYENIKQMSVTVRVTDSQGLYATGVIEITIMDENDPPLIVSTKEYYLQENAALGTEIGRIIADDPDYSRDYGKSSLNLNIVYEDPNFLERGSHIASDEIAFSSDSIRNIFVDDMSKYWQTDEKNVSLIIDINKNLKSHLSACNGKMDLPQKI